MKLRCLSVIFLFLLGMVFASCRTSREIPKDCTNYIFENQSDYRSYFIRLDYIDGTYAEGRAYSIDDDLLMEADAFTVNVRKNKCKVRLCDTIVYTLKLKSYADGIYGGGFTGDNISGKKSFMASYFSHVKPQILRTDHSPSSTPRLAPASVPIYYLSELISYFCPLWSLQP